MEVYRIKQINLGNRFKRFEKMLLAKLNLFFLFSDFLIRLALNREEYLY